MAVGTKGGWSGGDRALVSFSSAAQMLVVIAGMKIPNQSDYSNLLSACVI